MAPGKCSETEHSRLPFLPQLLACQCIAPQLYCLSFHYIIRTRCAIPLIGNIITHLIPCERIPRISHPPNVQLDGFRVLGEGYRVRHRVSTWHQPPPALRTKMSGMHKVQCGNEVEHARAPVNVSFLNGLHVTNKEEHQSNPSYRRYLNLF